MKVTHTIDPSVVDTLLNEALEKTAEDLADFVIETTFFENDRSRPAVDTGAFIKSWSFAIGSGRPRGQSSSRKPRNQNAIQKAQEGRALLQQDIDKMDMNKVRKSGFTIRNGAPHAKYVDLKHFYGIEARIRAWQP
jgi:hypothetical protein